MLPDVLQFVQLLGSLQRPDAKLATAGKPSDLVEAAQCFLWPTRHDPLPPKHDFFITRAPGRLDLMGGIADYSGSLVLQMPIAEATLAAVQLKGPSATATIRAVSPSGNAAGRAASFETPLTSLLTGGV